MQNWGPAARFLGVGFYIAFCIIIGVLGGLWLDRRFHTEPIFLLIGLVLGLVVSSALLTITVEGARAMLQVRALYLNGQWEEFLGLRIEREQARLYGRLAA